MPALNILVADDHRLVAHAVRKILEEQPEWHVVAEAMDGRDAVRMAVDCRPDVAVMDVSMPNLNGVDATAQLTESVPDIKVLMLSMYSDQEMVGRSLRAGARGYLLKHSADVDLVRAVAAIASGESFFSPAIANSLVDDYVNRLSDSRHADRLDRLSPREREVFQLIAEGYTNREIGERLHIRVATVETHRARILEKLNLHGMAELVRFAMQRGVIQ